MTTLPVSLTWAELTLIKAYLHARRSDPLRDLSQPEAGLLEKVTTALADPRFSERRRKLSREQVHAIKARLAAGVSIRPLAREFGVSHGTVGKIAQGVDR